MKLLHCKHCKDIVRLVTSWRQCICGESQGRYVDGVNAVFNGKDAVIICLGNNSFFKAIKAQKDYATNSFIAFVPPKISGTIKRADL